MSKITVLGAGGFGIALAVHSHACGHDVTIWTPFEDEAKLLIEERTNEKLLSGIFIPETIAVTTDMSVVEGSDITILAVPSKAVRTVAKSLSVYKRPGVIVNVSKGIEKDTFLRMSEVIEQEIPTARIVVLSGPSHAEEVARRIPTSIVAASKSLLAATIVQTELSNEYFRIYTSDDMIGVELGGALKNAIAICAGICDGLKLGDNSKAALITRGLSEMAKLGVKMGAKEKTFAGLTGIGDLVVTCTSRHSRNNRFGYLVGSGTDVKTALETVGTVEGYYATYVGYQLAQKYEVSMPIIEICYGVLYEGQPTDTVVKRLMLRPKGSEN
ncbi:MAG: NAD(P)-dependent glycerol-3-phosphate dehydrogenase [Clostridia bacterium]|nr:NAD(P)-dependent glycerol-3-phosphate dehydrogenase [Clostridia bacterium]